MHSSLFFISAVVFINCVNGVKLPSYMTKCSMSDPNRDECAKKAANDALPYVVDGVKELKIPSLKPLLITKVEIQHGPELKLTMKNIKCWGLDKMTVQYFDFNYTNTFWQINTSVPILTMLYDYEIDGRLMFLPIQGKGEANYTLIGGFYNFHIKFDIKPLKEGGKDHVVIRNNSADITVEKTEGKFENLFNSNKLLAPYIERCSRSAPNLDDCFITSGNKAIPHLINGEKELKIPSFSPLLLDEVHTQQSSGLHATLTKLKITGFEEAVIVDARIDLEKKNWKFNILIPFLNITSDYELSGRLLLLPFEGHGTCLNSIIGAVYNYTMDYEFKTKKDNKQYMNITKNHLVFYPKKAYSYYNNLFNGDKTLGDITNRVLNDNWQEFHKEINPVVAEIISTILTTILNKIFRRVPYDDIFLP